MEFEIIKIEQQLQRISIEIEIIATRERKFYGYPLGEGWEIDVNGEPRFLRDIRKKLQAEEEVSKQTIDFSKLQKKVVGKKIKINDK